MSGPPRMISQEWETSGWLPYHRNPANLFVGTFNLRDLRSSSLSLAEPSLSHLSSSPDLSIFPPTLDSQLPTHVSLPISTSPHSHS